ncbi:MAG: YggT family protein [Gemmatimonadota bacterium]|nr:YggT family protein [Gemmatimonadota bacterium]MDE2831999.1 YggT family protein [Gemmatimonadota bacterium]MDE2954097.1 YggT family protein [Gemmatimonadota bacterium]
MFFLANLLTIYGYIIIARALISWINPNPYNPLIRIIYAITDPVLVPIRRLLPDMGGLDISPFVALVIIWFIIFLI